MLNQERILSLALVVFVVTISLAFAFSDTAVTQGTTLVKASDALSCKIDFTVAILTVYQTTANATNLSSVLTALGKDKAQLQTLASAGNASAVREFVKNTLEGDLKSARGSVEGIRGTTHKDLTKEQKQSLKDSYKKAQDTFKVCHQGGLKALGDKRVEEFTKILDQHSALADRFATKGIDVSGMKKVIEDAKTQIVTPLKDALAKANSTDEIQAAVRKYCLFDGCKSGMNFHFAAKFEIEKLTATLAYIKANNISISDDQVSRVQGSITSARGVLADIGATQYADDGKNVRNSIQSAYGDLKNVRVKARVVAKENIKTREPVKEVKNNEQKR